MMFSLSQVEIDVTNDIMIIWGAMMQNMKFKCIYFIYIYHNTFDIESLKIIIRNDNQLE